MGRHDECESLARDEPKNKRDEVEATFRATLGFAARPLPRPPNGWPAPGNPPKQVSRSSGSARVTVPGSQNSVISYERTAPVVPL